VILAGGGAIDADLTAFAEHMDAPVVSTVNARGVLAAHPLCVPASPSLKPVRNLLADSDLVIAIGTQFGPTDFDMYMDGAFPTLKQLIRIDVDSAQANKGPKADLTIVGSAAGVVDSLLPLLQPRSSDNKGATAAAGTNKLAYETLPQTYRDHINVLKTISATLANVVMVGDST